MNLFLCALNYVVSDSFFWASMSFTTMVGIFIGAVIYNGDVREIKKALVSLFCYAMLAIATNLSRIIPLITGDGPPQQPFASTVTLLLVTIFYLFGMYLGVRVTKIAHQKRV